MIWTNHEFFLRCSLYFLSGNPKSTPYCGPTLLLGWGWGLWFEQIWIYIYSGCLHPDLDFLFTFVCKNSLKTVAPPYRQWSPFDKLKSTLTVDTSIARFCFSGQIRLNLISNHLIMLCAKFSWNRPSCSREEDGNVKTLLQQQRRPTTHLVQKILLEPSAQVS